MNKRHIVAGLLLFAGGAALYMLNRRQVIAEITPRPLLYLVADTQRELERIPLELTRVSDQEENQIGDNLARNFGLLPQRITDPEQQRMQEYLNTVGSRVSANVRRKAIHYRFHYVPQDGLVNAAALPGGHIVFGRGLLKLLEAEDELAAVLGHEMAHVDQRHAIERLQYELKSRQLGLGGLYQLGAMGIALFQAGYTKEKELEADRVGLGFAVRADYSPGGAIDLMQRFAKLRPAPRGQATSPVEEVAGVPLQALREYFRSHPPESERIATLEAEIAAHRWNANQARRLLAVRAIFVAEAARELDRHGQFEQAIKRYQEALQLDPNYLLAWRGLARTNWRSGDAEATVKTATEALTRKPDEEEMWELLARALAAVDHRAAPEQFRGVLQTLNAWVAGDASFIIHTELAGLELFSGRTKALESYRKLVESGRPARTEATLRRRMAWWMYRAGKLQDAEKELNIARQRFFQDKEIDLELAWVQSDLGHQADAQEALAHFLGKDWSRGDSMALEALIRWRTDQRDAAKTAFRDAAQNDPAWLAPRWAANNYSSQAAAVLGELRVAELARRKQAELLARRPAALQPNPDPR